VSRSFLLLNLRLSLILRRHFSRRRNPNRLSFPITLYRAFFFSPPRSPSSLGIISRQTEDNLRRRIHARIQVASEVLSSAVRARDRSRFFTFSRCFINSLFSFLFFPSFLRVFRSYARPRSRRDHVTKL